MGKEKTIRVEINTIISLSKVAQRVYAYALINEKGGIAEIRPEDLYKDLGYTNGRMIYSALKELTEGDKPLLARTGSIFRYYVNKI